MSGRQLLQHFLDDPSVDLSALVTLRVLLARQAAPAGAPVLSDSDMLMEIRDQYHRLGVGPGNAAANPAPSAGETLPPGDSILSIARQGVRHLRAAEILQPYTDRPASGSDASPRTSLRLHPTIRAAVEEDAAGVLDAVDERIRSFLGFPDEEAPGEEGQNAPTAEPDREPWKDADEGSDSSAEPALVGATAKPWDPVPEAAAVHTAPAPQPYPRPGVSPPARSTLTARGLVKIYRKRRVVNDVDVQLSEGEIVGLLGPNGAGKTTTFYMMVGLIAPDQGAVYLDGENLTAVPMYKRARRGIGYLAQEPSIFRKLTVEENVLAILEMRRFSRRERRERLERLLDELGIKHLRQSKAYTLSGGERRRLEITRALVGEPKFMLLDEPFAGVDPIAVHDIQQIVADLRRRGIGVLISDHNVEQTLDIVDRAYIMYDGRVRVSGTVSELVWNDEAAEIYLGPTLTSRMRERYRRPENENAS